MRAVPCVVLGVVVASLLGCASPRLVQGQSAEDGAPVGLASRYDGEHPAPVFVYADPETERLCTPVPDVEAEEEAKNHFNVFLGWTVEEDHNGGSIGIDYMRRIGGPWGVGGFAEYTIGDLRELVLGALVFYEPTERFLLIGGVGIARSREEADTPLLRVGVAYEIPVGRGYKIGPGVFVDWMEHQFVFIAGLNFAKDW